MMPPSQWPRLNPPEPPKPKANTKKCQAAWAKAPKPQQHAAQLLLQQHAAAAAAAASSSSGSKQHTGTAATAPKPKPPVPKPSARLPGQSPHGCKARALPMVIRTEPPPAKVAVQALPRALPPLVRIPATSGEYLVAGAAAAGGNPMLATPVAKVVPRLCHWPKATPLAKPAGAGPTSTGAPNTAAASTGTPAAVAPAPQASEAPAPEAPKEASPAAPAAGTGGVSREAREEHEFMTNLRFFGAPAEALWHRLLPPPAAKVPMPCLSRLAPGSELAKKAAPEAKANAPHAAKVPMPCLSKAAPEAKAKAIMLHTAGAHPLRVRPREQHLGLPIYLFSDRPSDKHTFGNVCICRLFA
jgi:hypothetical protein